MITRAFDCRTAGISLRPAFIFVVLMAAACSMLPSPAPNPREMSFAVPSFSPPQFSRHTLPNGMVVFLLEDHELPLIVGQALIRVGSLLEPPDKSGLAGLCGDLLVQGGTAEHPGSHLDEILESRAIKMSGHIGQQSGKVLVDSLASEWDEALRLFADVLRKPVFAEEKFELARKRAVEEAVRIVDDPDDLTFREFRRFFYGNDPRGRTPSKKTLEGIRRDEVVDFYRQHFHPDRVILGFVGDFDSSAMMEKLADLFGDWPPSGEFLPEFPAPVQEGADDHLNIIDKDLPQATLVMGHYAPPKDSEEYAPFMVANFILGEGGFNSRLMREIRSNRGLAYSVGSFYRGDIGYGVFVSWCKTKNETAAEALEMMVELAGEMKKGKITEKDLAWAREAIINGTIFRLSTPSSILTEALSLEYDGLPPDFSMILQKRIREVTLEEVKNTAAESMRPARATMVILGREDQLQGSWPSEKEIRKYRLSADGEILLK